MEGDLRLQRTAEQSALFQFMEGAAKVSKPWNQSLVQHAAKAIEEPNLPEILRRGEWPLL